MDSFVLEVLGFMGSLGLRDLEGSGLRFPAVGWDWDDCCHACVWLACLGHSLPGNLHNRMMMGPLNSLVEVYVRLLEYRRRGGTNL